MQDEAMRFFYWNELTQFVEITMQTTVSIQYTHNKIYAHQNGNNEPMWIVLVPERFEGRK